MNQKWCREIGLTGEVHGRKHCHSGLRFVLRFETLVCVVVVHVAVAVEGSVLLQHENFRKIGYARTRRCSTKILKNLENKLYKQ